MLLSLLLMPLLRGEACSDLSLAQNTVVQPAAAAPMVAGPADDFEVVEVDEGGPAPEPLAIGWVDVPAPSVSGLSLSFCFFF